MLHVLFAEGLTGPPAYVDRRRRRSRRLVERLHPRARRAASGIAADEIRRLAREFAAARRRPRRTAGSASRPTASARSASGRIQCLNMLTGNFDREGGVLFTEPAVDFVARGLDRARALRPVAQPGARDRRSSAASCPVAVAARGDRDAGRGPDPRDAHASPATRCSRRPTASASATALDGLDFMAAIDIYLNETTRHADVILPPTTALERDHYDLVFHGLAVRNTARFTPARLPQARGRHARLGDLPRARAAAAAPAGPPSRRCAKRLGAAGPARAEPDRTVAGLLRTGTHGRRCGSCARTPKASTSARCARPCPGGCRPRTTASTSRPTSCVGDLPRLRTWLATRPRTDELLLIGRRHQQDNNSWMHNIERLTRGRPRHQLLMHPDDLAERGHRRRRAGAR